MASLSFFSVNDGGVGSHTHTHTFFHTHTINGKAGSLLLKKGKGIEKKTNEKKEEEKEERRGLVGVIVVCTDCLWLQLHIASVHPLTPPKTATCMFCRRLKAAAASIRS